LPLAVKSALAITIYYGKGAADGNPQYRCCFYWSSMKI